MRSRHLISNTNFITDLTPWTNHSRICNVTKTHHRSSPSAENHPTSTSARTNSEDAGNDNFALIKNRLLLLWYTLIQIMKNIYRVRFIIHPANDIYIYIYICEHQVQFTTLWLYQYGYPSGTEFPWENIKIYFQIPSFFSYWEDTCNWKLLAMKTKICLTHIVNTMAADDIAMQGAGVLTAMILGKFTQNISTSAPYGLTNRILVSC